MRARYEDGGGVVWVAGLLFGLLLIPVLLLMVWTLRAVLPVPASPQVAVVEMPTPPAEPAPVDPVPSLTLVLAGLRTEHAALATQAALLDGDLARRAAACASPGPVPLATAPAPEQQARPLTAERWSQGDLEILQGCWSLGRDAQSVVVYGDGKTRNCLVRAGRICFDAKGQGRREQTISCGPDLTAVCRAPVVGRFAGDGSFSVQQPGVACEGNSPTIWHGRSLVCRRVDDGKAVCRDSGAPEHGIPAQHQEFRRIR